MSTVKPYLTYEQQLQLLKDRGCIITDDEFSKTVLANVSYYRLSAYFLPFKNPDSSYKPGTSFEKVYHIYEFDRKLRNILFAAIEVVEVFFRARLAYFHAGKYGPLGYLDPTSFNAKHDAKKFLDLINQEIKNNEKVPFVRHHLDNYAGQFPLWVIVELFTFGNLSCFYADMTTADRKAFAGRHYNDMIGWLKCCSGLRNICAHYGRLYNRVFGSIPVGLGLAENEKRSLWGAVVCLKELYPSADKWNREIIPLLSSLFDEYKNDIELSHMAFPADWIQKLKKSI